MKKRQKMPGFAPAYVVSLLRLVKGAAKLSTFKRRV
jgi:hypothetical protein